MARPRKRAASVPDAPRKRAASVPHAFCPTTKSLPASPKIARVFSSTSSITERPVMLDFAFS
eukprot:scaffold94365_cov51-Phaeocystis_antarctica.AAC.2